MASYRSSACCRSMQTGAARPAAVARALGLRPNSLLHAVPSTAAAGALHAPQQQQQQQQMSGATPTSTQLRQPVSSVSTGIDATSSSNSSLQHAGAQISLGLAVALLALSAATAEPAAAADGMQHHSSIQPVFVLAEGEEFWGNVAKYGRYFVTVMLGTGYVMVQPLIAAFKRPVTAIVAVVGIGGSIVLLKFVLNAMLGIQEPFDYEPGSVVPYNF